MYLHTYTTELAISTASFTAKRTAQMETRLMVVRDLHAPFILHVNVTIVVITYEMTNSENLHIWENFIFKSCLINYLTQIIIKVVNVKFNVRLLEIDLVIPISLIIL